MVAPPAVPPEEFAAPPGAAAAEPLVGEPGTAPEAVAAGSLSVDVSATSGSSCCAAAGGGVGPGAGAAGRVTLGPVCAGAAGSAGDAATGPASPASDLRPARRDRTTAAMTTRPPTARAPGGVCRTDCATPRAMSLTRCPTMPDRSCSERSSVIIERPRLVPEPARSPRPLLQRTLSQSGAPRGSGPEGAGQRSRGPRSRPVGFERSMKNRCGAPTRGGRDPLRRV